MPESRSLSRNLQTLTIPTFSGQDAEEDRDLFPLEVRPHGDRASLTRQGLPQEALTPLLPDSPNCSGHEFSRFCQALRIRFAYQNDKLLSLSNSRTRLLPHQIRVVDRVVHAPRPRFILADEVGLGKTIEAGLVMKELQFRFGYKRILIVTPASLQKQWQAELADKFNALFPIIDRKLIRKHTKDSKARSPKKGAPRGQAQGNNGSAQGNGMDNGDVNAGEKNQQAEAEDFWGTIETAIVSLDFVKLPAQRAAACSAQWDIVIFDEAHRLRRDRNKTTQGYELAAELASKCKALLCLTATPFRGKLEELYYLSQLVDPHLFGSYNRFYDEYVLRENGDLREKMSRILIRHRKAEVGGFTKRRAKTVRIQLSEPERRFYNAVTEYVRHGYDLAVRENKTALSFVMLVYQRLLDSSLYALQRALQKRLARLEHRLGRSSFSLDQAGSHLSENCETDALMADGQFWDDIDVDIDSELFWELLSANEAGENPLGAMRAEVQTLRALLAAADGLQRDKKVDTLKRTIRKFQKEGYTKFLIFTEFRSTQDHLERHLKNYNVALFHGGLSRDAKEEAIQAFANDAEVLICTEAGGEGRNMQWAQVLINYDLPWSPLKIEQRIGRLHRYGQKKDVLILNMAGKDTVAEKVLEVLQEKIRLFENAIGESDELLGVLQSEVDFTRTFASFLRKRGAKTALGEMESALKIARDGYRKLNRLLTPQKLDFELSDYYEKTEKRRDYDNSHIESFVLDYLGEHGGQSPDGWRLTKQSSNEFLISKEGEGHSHKATFNVQKALSRSDVEFLACGHPMVDGLLDHLTAPAITPHFSAAKLARRSRPADHPLSQGGRTVYFLFGQFRFTAGDGSTHLTEVCLNLKTMKSVSLPVIGGKLTPIPMPPLRHWKTKLQTLSQLAEANTRRILQNQRERNQASSEDYRREVEQDFDYRLEENRSREDLLRARIRWNSADGQEDAGTRPEVKGQLTRLANERRALESKKAAALAQLQAVHSLNIQPATLLLFHY